MPEHDAAGRRWKRISFQLLRDGAGNAMTVCSMEHVLPDSAAAVSPTMTLANPEYQMLRSEALALAAEKNTVGAALVTFLLDAGSFDHEVLEYCGGCVSGFARAATGYPVEKVADSLASGAHLDSAEEVDGVSPCCEPAPDYLAVCLAGESGEFYGTGDRFPDAFCAAVAAGGVPDGQILCAISGFREGRNIGQLQAETGINRWFLSEIRKAGL